MRFWILLSFLLTPMASSALAADQCPVADGWYRRWANCDAHLRTFDVGAQQRVRAIVEAHTVESGSAVTWAEETRAIFDLLPADLQRREALEYIQCRDFAAGRVCKDQWEARSQCLTLRRGSSAMEFSAGTTVEIAVRTTKGVDFRATSAALPRQATAQASGGVRFDDGRLRWNLTYGRGDARITVPESAGPWTLAFDDLATLAGSSKWEPHALGYASGSNSPLVRQLQPETRLEVRWSCPAR